MPKSLLGESLAKVSAMFSVYFHVSVIGHCYMFTSLDQRDLDETCNRFANRAAWTRLHVCMQIRMVDVLPELIDIVKKKGKVKCEEGVVAAVFIDTTALLIIAGACFRKPDAMMDKGRLERGAVYE